MFNRGTMENGQMTLSFLPYLVDFFYKLMLQNLDIWVGTGQFCFRTHL